MIIVEEKEDGEDIIKFDFSSSRYILITCGWVMAVSNFFDRTYSKLIQKKYKSIYKPKPLNLGPLNQKCTIIKTLNLHENVDKFSRISYLSKILRSRIYTV